MVELLFPRTLSEDMKDVFIHPIGLGLRGVTRIRNVTFLNPLTYLVYYDFLTVSTPRNDIRPRYPEHSLVASEPTAALQDTDALFEMNPQR